MYIGLHVIFPLFLSDFNENSISQQIFKKSSNRKFYKYPFRESPRCCIRAEGRRQADMTTLTVVFRNFANASKHRIIRQCRSTQAHSTATFQNYTIFSHALLPRVHKLQILRLESHRGCPCSARGPAAARMTNASPSLIDPHSNVN